MQKESAGSLIEVLTRALSMIGEDTDGHYLSNGFEDMAISLSAFPPPGVATIELRSVLTALSDLHTIAHKTRWLADRRDEGTLDEFIWMYFFKSDLLAFHVQTRSIFDYVATFLSSVSTKKGVVPTKSFNDLRKWLAVPGRAEKLGTKVASVVTSCAWFSELRRVRDDLVHFGAEPVAFPEPGPILFQVYKRTEMLILTPEVMKGENTVDFERYAAVVWARLLGFLDDLAGACLEAQLVPKPDGGPVRAYNPGISILRGWTEALRDELQ